MSGLYGGICMHETMFLCGDMYDCGYVGFGICV